MKPYWEDGSCRLYLGDCREILPELAAEGLRADCAIADVPYGETSLKWDRWPDGWLEVTATITNSLWCFGSLRMYLDHAAEFRAHWKFSQDVIWEKHNGTGFATDRFKRVHEQVTHWYRGEWSALCHDTPRVPYVGPDKHARARNVDRGAHLGAIGTAFYEDDGTRLMRTVQRVPSVRGGIHRTQKPGGIIRPLIEYACPVGGLVVDPFAGSASTLDAARFLGRRSIGIEADEGACSKAAAALSQGDLFGGECAS